MSLTAISAQWTICSLFEQLIGRQHWSATNNIGIGFTVRMDGDHYGSTADGNTKHQYGEGHSTQRLHFLMFGNVSVYTYHDTNFEYTSAADVPPDRWVWRSDHDSCWRDVVGNELHKVQAALGVRYCGPGSFGTDDLYTLVSVDVLRQSYENPVNTIVAVRKIDLDKPGLGHTGDLLHLLSLSGRIPAKKG